MSRTGFWDHPNGKEARDSYGRLYREDGSETPLSVSLVERFDQVVLEAEVTKDSEKIAIHYPDLIEDGAVDAAGEIKDDKIELQILVSFGVPNEYLALKVDTEGKSTCTLQSSATGSDLKLIEPAATVHVRVNSGYDAEVVKEAIHRALHDLKKKK